MIILKTVSYTHLDVYKRQVLGLLKQTVRPEFINRIDEIVMFTPLTSANIKQIVGLQLKSVTKMLAHQNITMDAVSYTHLDVYKRQIHSLFITWNSILRN